MKKKNLETFVENNHQAISELDAALSTYKPKAFYIAKSKKEALDLIDGDPETCLKASRAIDEFINKTKGDGLTREKKIEALAEEHDAECWRIAPYKEVGNSDSFKAGILAGLALRDAELLAMEFDDGACEQNAKQCGYTSANLFLVPHSNGARWQFEQFMKAIKGDGDE